METPLNVPAAGPRVDTHLGKFSQACTVVLAALVEGLSHVYVSAALLQGCRFAGESILVLACLTASVCLFLFQLSPGVQSSASAHLRYR